ncbi:MAG: fatty acid desaturase [Bdellovibrionaceae bacterium]|nr:fatty acid desaturase [Pseudobdellovibrionaceae bacterium]
MENSDRKVIHSSLEQLRTLSSFRGLTPCFLSWMSIAGAIAAAKYFSELYPLAILLIANRIFALFLLSHEAVHSLLTPHRRLNDIVGRYLCAFPLGISFQLWRSKHLLHHRFLGSGLDPDLPIYTELFKTWPSFLRLFFSGRVSFILMIYFTPVHRLLHWFGIEVPFHSTLARLSTKDQQALGFAKSDAVSYLLFYVVCAFAIVALDLEKDFALYWVIPHFLVQFYFPIWSHLQHGTVFNDPQFERRSRTINSPLWSMPLIMPVNVRFHLEHHLYPFVPQYRLASAMALVANDPKYQDRYESFLDALRSRRQVKTDTTADMKVPLK